MTRNFNPGPPPDGGIITRPGRRAAHMPKVARLPFTRPEGTEGRNERSVVTDPSLLKALGDLSRALRSMAPAVLGTELIALDATGAAGRQFRVPFGALSVINESTAALTVASSPLGQSPGPGPSAGRVPPRSFAVLNLAGYAWSVYGGNLGDFVTITTYARPQPPFCAPLGSSALASVSAVGSANAPAAFNTVADAGQIPAGTYTAAITPELTGTVGPAELNNMRLVVGSVLYPLLVNPADGITPNPPFRIVVPAGGADVKVTSQGTIATAGSVYGAQILLTPAG